MHTDYLVRMANDIGHFFAAEPDQDEATRNVLSHIKRFWDPRMRAQIIEHYRSGAVGLDAIVAKAIGMLAQETHGAS